MDLTFVTSNKNKAKEAEHILGFPIEVKDIDLDEIQDLSVEKVAEHKLQQAHDLLKSPVLIDDVGVYIDAWNGFPGPLIKWILKVASGKSDLLLQMLENEDNRQATAQLVIGFHDGKKPHMFVGEVSGKISYSRKGDSGFGWDEVFIPDGHEKTFAQMSLEEKNRISHRQIALEKLKNHLKLNKVI